MEIPVISEKHFGDLYVMNVLSSCRGCVCCLHQTLQDLFSASHSGSINPCLFGLNPI